MSRYDMDKILENREYYYKYYLIKKKRGGFRRIIAPYKQLKELQRWIKENIIDQVDINQFATGFVKDKSIYHNAKIHEDANVILNIDLKNFFESITEKRVYGLFKSLGYAHNLAVDLAKICTSPICDEKLDELDESALPYFQDIQMQFESILIQGSPSSPAISNLICRRLDRRLSKLANSTGANSSRYADDITFSGSEDNIPKVSLIKRIIEGEGFSINWEKVKRHKKGQRQIVTGLLVDNEIRVPKKYKKDIYRHLHFCEKWGSRSHFEKINPGKGYGKQWLLGRIMYVNSIEPTEAKKMMALVKQIDWDR
ncbi:MAG: reverse transcriptase family protein [Odoribacter splanchnicus]